MKVYPFLDLCDASRVVMGQHSAWMRPLPNLGTWGVKVPFQWGGRLTKYTRQEATYDLTSLRHEYTILKAMAELHMAPGIGEWVYFQQVRSTYPGFEWVDPCGAFGFEMQDVGALPRGLFDIEAMLQLPIAGSPGAWNDIGVPERRNVRNGYLVDVRRSVFDMLSWTRLDTLIQLPVRPRPEELALVVELASFPKGERPEPYQEYYLDGAWHPGARRVVPRAQAVGFVPRATESVLDIGCHVGGFLQYAALPTGQGCYVGVDVDADYLAFGAALANANQQNICFLNADVAKGTEIFIHKIQKMLGRPDHLLLLSVWKHLGSAVLWQLVDGLHARHTYIESQPTVDGSTPLDAEIAVRGGCRMGESSDRNRRILFRIDKE